MSIWSKEENIRNASHWLSRKIELIELKSINIKNSTKINVLRGGVFNVELGEGNIGGEKNKKRPCLVLSRNALNNGDTVVIVPLTTKFKKEIQNGVIMPKYNNHYILKKANYDFLIKDSCIKCEDIRAVDKVRVNEHLGNINVEDLERIKARMLFALGY